MTTTPDGVASPRERWTPVQMAAFVVGEIGILGFIPGGHFLGSSTVDDR